MSPLEQLQSDVTVKLLSESALSTIAINSLRKMRIDSELDVALLLGVPRAAGGVIGCGLVVGMPTLDVEHPNTPGPHLTVALPIRIYEDPLNNLLAGTGTMTTAEDVGVLLVKLLHQFAIEGLCSLYAGKDALRPADSDPGTICYEATLRGELPEDTILRVTQPTIDEADLTVTLTPVEEATAIYYTLDDTFPGPGNADAIAYANPFPVPSGTFVRWAGYIDGWQGSDIGRAQINRGILATEPTDLSKIIIPQGGGIII